MTPEDIHLRIVEIVRDNHLQDADYNVVNLSEGNDYGIPAGTYVFGRDGKWRLENYCCPMRKHYLIGIVGQRNDQPMPTEAADFIAQWEPKLILNIRYCPFCGNEITPDQTMRG